ncbi:MAG: TonB-dependent receptor [Caldithrix sp.]|nr:MAG: TonB-dependent receptor [Caldithrix sp.]
MKQMHIFLICTLGLISSLYAQTSLTGSIKGRVVDKTTKQPLPGANVVIVGTNRGAASDPAGFFVIEGVKEDIYKLKVTFIGYNTFIETDVRVVRHKTAYVEDIELISSSVAMREVLVTDGLFNDDEQAPVSYFTYTREEIRRAPGSAGDVFRAMETLPGVSTSGGEFSAFSVRGGSPKENIILIDNIPFGKVTHFNGGSEEQEAQGGRFSIFAPGLIEEANFQAGGFSAIYGGKFSSFLDLKIKEGNTENPTVDGRIDVLGWEINYDGPLPALKNSSMVVSARHQDFTRILELTGQEEFGSPRFTDIIAKITTEFSHKNKLSFLAIWAPENFDRTVKDVFESDDFASTDLTDLDEQKTLLGVNWRFLTSKSTFLQNSIYFRRTDRDITVGRAWPVFVNGEAPQSEEEIRYKDILSEDSHEYEFGMRSIFSIFPSDNSTFRTGFEVSRTTFNLVRTQNGLDTLYFYDQNDFRPHPAQKFIITSPEFVNNNFDDTKTILAAFTEYSFRPFDKLTLNAGLRYEYNEFNNQHYFAPRGSGSFTLNPKTRLNFATGIYYQTPEFDILTADARNVDLSNEKSYHFILGLSRYLRDDLKLTTEIYYKQFSDLIVRNDRTNQLRRNDGDGWAAGIDLSLIKRFVNKFYGQINYSYAQSKRDDHNGEGEYNSDFNQPHIFSILGGYEFNKEWSISAKWRFATGRPKDSFIVHENIFNDPNFVRYSKEITRNNGERLSDFHTFNVRVDYRKQLGRIALVSFLDVVNLYSHLNVNEDRFLEITGGEDRRGFNILPTGGLKIEF